MLVICPFSGVEHKTTLFGKHQSTHPHPIFSVSPRELVDNYAQEWASLRFTEKERRLLFVALLRSTSLVEFRSIPAPTDATIQLMMEPLLRTTNWVIELAPVVQKFLPRFVVSRDTDRLTNLSVWLRSWEDAKQSWYEGKAQRAEKDKLLAQEQTLEKLIKSASKSSENYASQLADWALAAAPVAAPVASYWKKLFKLKGFEVYNIRPVDLEELVEHMEAYIPHGSIYAHAVLKHVRHLRDKNKKGLTAELGLLHGTDVFELIEDDIQTHNIQIAVARAPVNEPREAEIGTVYPNRVAYLRAKSAFNLARMQEDKQQAAVNEHKQAIKQIALDISSEEEVDSAVKDDLAQLKMELGMGDNYDL